MNVNKCMSLVLSACAFAIGVMNPMGAHGRALSEECEGCVGSEDPVTPPSSNACFVTLIDVSVAAGTCVPNSAGHCTQATKCSVTYSLSVTKKPGAPACCGTQGNWDITTPDGHTSGTQGYPMLVTGSQRLNCNDSDELALKISSANGSCVTGTLAETKVKCTECVSGS